MLAVTTSGRSSAILDSKNRQLCKGFDVTAERTTSGVDFILMGLMVIAAAALTFHQPPDRRAGSNQ